MARAKNTQRALARRRYRDDIRANTLSTDVYDDDESADTAAPPRDLTPEPPRRSGLAGMFSMPDIRGDLKAFPGMMLSQKRLWIPFIALLIGFAIAAAYFWGYLGAETGDLALLAFTLVLSPQALFVPFIAGFLAPRGAYLLGALVGLLDGLLVAILFNGPVAAGRGGTVLASAGLGDIISIFVVAVLFATFAAAFASWYRRFLRQSQERAKANRAIREQQMVVKRREEDRKAKIAEREARRSSPR